MPLVEITTNASLGPKWNPENRLGVPFEFLQHQGSAQAIVPIILRDYSASSTIAQNPT
jgi:hypothetical protein